MLKFNWTYWFDASPINKPDTNYGFYHINRKWKIKVLLEINCCSWRVWVALLFRTFTDVRWWGLRTCWTKHIEGWLTGIPSINGLSTDQRKRLTIAIGLVANPSILFMGEPTSNLDARAAAVVMRTVWNTVDTGRTVVCTIHQPSIDIFEAFDEVNNVVKWVESTFHFDAMPFTETETIKLEMKFFLMKPGGEETYVGVGLLWGEMHPQTKFVILFRLVFVFKLCS